MSVQLSIVMPCFNHADMAAEMIDSIVANDFTDWELIVVDDGSNSDTLSVLDSYSHVDSRVRILHRERLPKGAPTCRNIGMDAAMGEYIIFFDNDDIITSVCLGRRVSMLAARPDLDFMVFPSGVLKDGNSYDYYPNNIFGYRVCEDDVAAFARRELPFIMWNNIYRLSSLRSHGIRWDENLKSLQDSDFNMMTLVAGMHYDYAATPPDLYYRLVGSSTAVTSKMLSEAHHQSHEYAMRKFYNLLKSQFGVRYLGDLCSGVMFMLCMVLYNDMNRAFADTMVAVVASYDPSRARTLSLRLRCAFLLTHVLPRSLCRKFTLLFYKVYLRMRLACNRKRVTEMIKLYSQYEKTYPQQH